MYYKGKWCTAGGKDPLFGHVDGFQIDPKKSLWKAFVELRRVSLDFFHWGVIINSGLFPEKKERKFYVLSYEHCGP